MRKIEIYGAQQAQLENVYHNKIREINAQLKKMYAEYNDWDNVDEKTKAIYHTPEEYKRRIIEYMLEKRKAYIYKLRDVRSGYIYE